MKPLEVKQQVRLGLGKCVDLVLSGIRFRLFRAAITVAIIALAVAFLVTMLTESFIARSVARAVNVQTAPRRMLLHWTSRLSMPLTESQLIRELNAAKPGDETWQEFSAWGELSNEQLAELKKTAEMQLSYLDFADELTEGQKGVILGRARGADIFPYLENPENFEQFISGIRKFGLQSKLPDGPDDVKSFVEKWAETKPLRERIFAGHKAAIAKVRTLLNGKSVKAALAEGDENLLVGLNALGYRLPKKQLSAVAKQAQLSLDAETLAKLLKIQKISQRLAAKNEALVTDVNSQMLFESLSSTEGAKWLLELIEENNESVKKNTLTPPALNAAEIKKVAREYLDGKNTSQSEELAKFADIDRIRKSLTAKHPDIKAEEVAVKIFFEELATDGQWLLDQIAGYNGDLVSTRIAPLGMTADRITSAAKNMLEESELSEVEASVSEAAGQKGFMGFSPRTISLLVVSLMVCIVGIANAMLMSVTERFREIATMKCLGATDGFIMVNFIMESCIQGTAGGIIGAVIGLLLGVLRAWANYGWIAMENLPFGELGVTASGCIGVGILMSALAAVYPAWVAARLAPMEAMRIE